MKMNRKVVGEPCPHFINAQHGLDVDAVLERRNDLVVEPDVFRRLGLHDGDAGAHVAGIADAGAGFHPELRPRSWRRCSTRFPPSPVPRPPAGRAGRVQGAARPTRSRNRSLRTRLSADAPRPFTFWIQHGSRSRRFLVPLYPSVRCSRSRALRRHTKRCCPSPRHEYRHRGRNA